LLFDAFDVVDLPFPEVSLGFAVLLPSFLDWSEVWIEKSSDSLTIFLSAVLVGIKLCSPAVLDDREDGAVVV
jgi:hypothetical protein